MCFMVVLLARIASKPCILIYILHSIPSTKVTDKKFAFAKKHGIPFEFVSAADGTNVVKVRIHGMLTI